MENKEYWADWHHVATRVAGIIIIITFHKYMGEQKNRGHGELRILLSHQGIHPRILEDIGEPAVLIESLHATA